jgi:hypothetical protein
MMSGNDDQEFFRSVDDQVFNDFSLSLIHPSIRTSFHLKYVWMDNRWKGNVMIVRERRLDRCFVSSIFTGTHFHFYFLSFFGKLWIRNTNDGSPEGIWNRSLTPQICRIKKARDVSYGQKTIRKKDKKWFLNARRNLDRKLSKQVLGPVIEEQTSISMHFKLVSFFILPFHFSL